MQELLRLGDQRLQALASLVATHRKHVEVRKDLGAKRAEILARQ